MCKERLQGMTNTEIFQKNRNQGAEVRFAQIEPQMFLTRKCKELFVKDKQKWNKDLCLENMYEYSKIQIFLMMKSMCSKWWTKGILIYQRNHQLRDLKVLPFGCVNGKCNFRMQESIVNCGQTCFRAEDSSCNKCRKCFSDDQAKRKTACDRRLEDIVMSDREKVRSRENKHHAEMRTVQNKK